MEGFRVAIVGAGNMGREHARAFARIPGVSVAGIASRTRARAEALASELGSPLVADEPGELVHRGALVSLGYWNDPVKTAERFRPAPGQDPALPLTELERHLPEADIVITATAKGAQVADGNLTLNAAGTKTPPEKW